MIAIVRAGDAAELCRLWCPAEGLHLSSVRECLSDNGVQGMLQKDGFLIPRETLLPPGSVLTLVPHIASFSEARPSSLLLKYSPSALTGDALRQIQQQRLDGTKSGEPGFLDFRPEYAVPYIPLPLAHPVFGYFLDTLTSTTDLPSKEDSFCLTELAVVTSQYFKREENLVTEVYPILKKYLGFGSLLQQGLAVGEGRTMDVALTNSEELMAIFKFKLSSSSNGVDAYTEGIHYFNCFWAHYASGFAAYQDSCYPGFAIEIVGPLLRVTAVARLGGKLCAQPLTSFINLLAMNGFNATMMDYSVRVLAALKKSLRRLADFYDNFRSSSGSIESRFWSYSIPYPLHSAAATPRKIGRLLYVVDTPDDRKMVIKFAERYGTEVHAAWSAAGFAPVMTSSNLPGGWIQVTMEYLGEGWESLDKCTDAETLRPAVVEALAAARRVPVQVGQLTGVGVHGDCRDCNVMVNRSGEQVQVRFIDFEWSGLHGVERYPQFMNHVQVKWPTGATDNALMYQEQDAEMIARPLSQQLKLIAYAV